MVDLVQFPSTGFLREKDVLFFFPVGRSTWRRGVESGKYPKSVNISKGIVAWRAEEILKVIQDHQKGEPNNG